MEVIRVKKGVGAPCIGVCRRDWSGYLCGRVTRRQCGACGYFVCTLCEKDHDIVSVKAKRCVECKQKGRCSWDLFVADGCLELVCHACWVEHFGECEECKAWRGVVEKSGLMPGLLKLARFRVTKLTKYSTYGTERNVKWWLKKSRKV